LPNAPDANPHQRRLRGLVRRCEMSYTIFEGTSEIQRLVIARSISGLHIQ
jgi:alkylation response protein AidB-like acyl-CoA dehydrogenase